MRYLLIRRRQTRPGDLSEQTHGETYRQRDSSLDTLNRIIRRYSLVRLKKFDTTKMKRRPR